jgi:hypothetical protein
MNDFIQLEKNDILKIGIKDADGKETGEHLEFDLEDVELPLKLNKCQVEHSRNEKYVHDQFTIIDKRQDKKGKYLLSYNEEEKCKVLQEFYKREMVSLDSFLGESGTKKLLNGRNPYWNMYRDIDKILEPILPLFKNTIDNIPKLIEDKYDSKEEAVLK